MQPVCVMTVAGSDSGGGAGIEADLRTFAALGVHGTAALSAVTAQNTLEVRAVCALEAEMVVCQINTVADDFTILATKTGMLARPATVRAVARAVAAGRVGHLVVDPVLVTSSGHPLMESGGVEAYRDSLLPLATVATPNLREAAVLADVDVRDLDSIEAITEVGRALVALGPRFVLVKGGHFAEGSATENSAPDVLVGAGTVEILTAERVVTRNDHGTGCSLAAAIVARLALGDDVPTAVRVGKDFVHGALRGASRWELGAGHGPIDHLGWSR